MRDGQDIVVQVVNQKGQELQDCANQPVGGQAGFPIYTQLGVVLYDEENYRTAGGTNDDPLNDNQQYTANGYNEPAEELWIDQNALSLMINRYNGTLVRGE